MGWNTVQVSVVDPKPSARPGSAPPSGRRIPLASVVFRFPIEAEKSIARVPRLTSGCSIADSTVVCPQMYLDTDLRVVIVGDKLYPFDGSIVEHVVRAKAAKG